MVAVALLSRAQPIEAQTADPPVRIPGHVLPALARANRVAGVSANASEQLTLTVVLNRSDEAGFASFLAGVEDPHSANVHRFLSQGELTFRFGPTQRAYDAVLAFLQRGGFTLVEGSANRLTLTVRGTRATAEAAFDVHLNDYQLGSRSFFANDTDPAVPASISAHIHSVQGLSNLAVPHSPLPAAADTVTANTGALTPMQIARAYGSGGLSAGINGAGQKIGLAEFSSFSPSDISSWLAYVGLPASLINQLSVVSVNGGTADTTYQDEVVLDVDAVMGAAQGANYVVYQAPNASATSNGTSFQTLFNAMIGAGDTVISNSWAYCESDTTVADVSGIESILASAAASGIAVFSSSGDSGATCTGATGTLTQTQVPADAPHGIAAGGTNLNVQSNGSWGSESVWSGSGYGVSTLIAPPSWQSALSVSGRSVPDVMADGDPATGIKICIASMGGCGLQFGGTSLSAPLWAASLALVNQSVGHLSGNLSPTLWSLMGSSSFHGGASLGAAATTIGVGSPILNNLVVALGGGSATVPGAPTIGIATGGNAQASVAFTAPASNGGSAITGYTAKAYAGGAATALTGAGTASPITVSGLSNGTAYTFTVYATNSAGNSAESGQSNSVTPSGAALTQVSSDPYTNSTSMHQTQVEADTFASGSTIVTAFQSGRFYDGGSSDIGWATSVDAGGTWTHGFLPCITVNQWDSTACSGLPQYGRVSDSSVAFDAAHGTWLIASLSLSSAGSGVAVLVSRSTDGTTWSNPVVVASFGNLDKSWIVCDNGVASPYRGHCYVEFDNNGDGDRLYMSTSADGGVTWGTALQTADSATGVGGQPLVQPGGTVIVPAANAFEGGIIAFRSTNGGASWSSTTTVAGIVDHGVAGSMRGGPLPSAEIDASGKVYVVWQDCRFEASCAANDIVMSTSTDGVSWSAVQLIPINSTGSGIDHFIPGLAVDSATSGGAVHLGLTYYFYSSANCTADGSGGMPACQLLVGFVSSSDGGAHWTAPAVLAGPMTVTWLPLTSQGYMVGDYMSASFANATAHPLFAVAQAPTSVEHEAMNMPTSGLAVTASAAANTSAGVQPVTDASDHAAAPAPITRR